MKISIGIVAALLLVAFVSETPSWLAGTDEVANNCVQTGTCGK